VVDWIPRNLILTPKSTHTKKPDAPLWPPPLMGQTIAGPLGSWVTVILAIVERIPWAGGNHRTKSKPADPGRKKTKGKYDPPISKLALAQP